MILDPLPLPKINAEQNNELKSHLTIKELEFAVKIYQNEKSPGNDGLPREFYIVI